MRPPKVNKAIAFMCTIANISTYPKAKPAMVVVLDYIACLEKGKEKPIPMGGCIIK